MLQKRCFTKATVLKFTNSFLSTSVRSSVIENIDRNQHKYIPSSLEGYQAPKKKTYKAIVVGGGHNGLVSAAYLAKAGVFI
jgi:pyruvate/2-oxoglutarate dehydrogenase complex dihydrolipoamide dehydrogenase (E3) component